jgi:hypothetical protein
MEKKGTDTSEDGVRMLAEYIHTRSPKAKGWSYRTIYKMVQFYETYSTQGFKEIVHHYGMQHYLSKSDQRELSDEKKSIVPFEMAQIEGDVIVPIRLAQIPNVLFATGWSNHQLIMRKSVGTDLNDHFFITHFNRLRVALTSLMDN